VVKIAPANDDDHYRSRPQRFAFGYNVLGPPKPRSLTHDAAHAFAIKGRISGNTFSYRGRRVDFLASLDAKDRMRVRADYRNGLVNEVWLYPVWTTRKANRPVMTQIPVQ